MLQHLAQELHLKLRLLPVPTKNKKSSLSQVVKGIDFETLQLNVRNF